MFLDLSLNVLFYIIIIGILALAILFVCLYMFDLRIRKTYNLNKMQKEENINKEDVKESFDQILAEDNKELATNKETEKTNNEAKDNISLNIINKVHKPAHFSRRRMVLLFSNLSNPFIEIKVYNKNNLERSFVYKLDSYQMNNGNFVNIDGIAKIISEEFPHHYPIDVVFACKEIFSNVITLPKISYSKAQKMYQKELKNSYPNAKSNYKLITLEHKYALGYAFTTYFIPNSLLVPFEKMAKLLKTTITSVNVYGIHLYKQIPIKNDYSCIYFNDNICTFLNVNNSKLVSTSSVAYNSLDELAVKFATLIGKHEMELEKKEINFCVIDENDKSGIENYLPSLNFVRIDFNTFPYIASGIKKWKKALV